MKSLLVVRHAKSSWDSDADTDFERPLNKRGHADAPEMARKLLSGGLVINGFISSPARRAKTTALYFVQEFGRQKEEIIYIKELYEASAAVFPQVIQTLDQSLDTVAIFAHNPGVTDFVNTLTATRVDNMPTCAVFAVKLNTDDWRQFHMADKEFLFFYYPKMTGLRNDD